jgi:hypothetical protein
MIRKIVLWGAVLVIGVPLVWFVALPLALNAFLGGVTHSPKVSISPYRPIGNALPTAGEHCEIRNFQQIDVPAEARKIEKLAAEIMPRIREIETDEALRMKFAELSRSFTNLRKTNVRLVSSAQECGSPYLFSLAPVMMQMVNDQGFGIFSDFPAMSVYWFMDDMPSHIYFTTGEKVKDFSVMFKWTDSMNEPKEFSVWIGKWLYIDEQTGHIRYAE